MDVKQVLKRIDEVYELLKDVGVTRDMVIAQRVSMLKPEEREEMIRHLEMTYGKK